MRPLLGLGCCLHDPTGDAAHAVYDRYVRPIAEQTGAAIVLVPALGPASPVADLADRLDGLVLTGSPSNVEPARYGAADGTGPFDPARDATSFGLIAAMIAAAKPVFGICRGFQELNVAFGGTLRHLPPGPDHHADTTIVGDAMFGHRHPVTLTPGGLLARVSGATGFAVNSVHYQGIGRLGDGLRIEARAADELVEAFAAIDTPAPVVAVQWHPEWEAGQTAGSAAFFTLLNEALGSG